MCCAALETESLESTTFSLLRTSLLSNSVRYPMQDMGSGDQQGSMAGLRMPYDVVSSVRQTYCLAVRYVSQ
nr:unnamed protein product [Spirometra erinaceieuropaei]